MCMFHEKMVAYRFLVFDCTTFEQKLSGLCFKSKFVVCKYALEILSHYFSIKLTYGMICLWPVLKISEGGIT